MRVYSVNTVIYQPESGGQLSHTAAICCLQCVCDDTIRVRVGTQRDHAVRGLQIKWPLLLTDTEHIIIIINRDCS